MNLIYTTQFKKDFKKVLKQGKDIYKMEYVINSFLRNEPLAPKYKDHSLSGKWKLH